MADAAQAIVAASAWPVRRACPVVKRRHRARIVCSRRYSAADHAGDKDERDDENDVYWRRVTHLRCRREWQGGRRRVGRSAATEGVDPR
jgi:ribosomal protein L36